MRIIKSILLFIFLFFLLIGLLFSILLLTGYSNIPDRDWGAISSIGALLSIIVSLFITLLQYYVVNKKVLDIQWLHVERNIHNRITYKANNVNNVNRRIDEICIRFNNRGNKKIIIENVFFKFKSEMNGHIIPNVKKQIKDNSEMSLPCILEPDIPSHFYFPLSDFINVIYNFIKNKHIKNNDYIIIQAIDTTGKIYSKNVGFKYIYYLQIRSNYGNTQ